MVVSLLQTVVAEIAAALALSFSPLKCLMFVGIFSSIDVCRFTQDPRPNVPRLVVCRRCIYGEMPFEALRNNRNH